MYNKAKTKKISEETHPEKNPSERTLEILSENNQKYSEKKQQDQRRNKLNTNHTTYEEILKQVINQPVYKHKTLSW